MVNLEKIWPPNDWMQSRLNAKCEVQVPCLNALDYFQGKLKQGKVESIEAVRQR